MALGNFNGQIIVHSKATGSTENLKESEFSIFIKKVLICPQQNANVKMNNYLTEFGSTTEPQVSKYLGKAYYLDQMLSQP
jgi:hypothetical protein